MKVIVIGAGKIGFSLAQILSIENHEVTVIDIDPSRIESLEENVDVHTIVGNGACPSVLEEAGISTTDLVAAVTPIDEVNIMACFVAKEYKNARTVARVSNPEYIHRNQLRLCDRVGIDLAINPERVTASVMARLVDVPEAVNVEYYANGKLQLIEIRIDSDSPAINRPLETLQFLTHPFLIVAIMRDEEIIIPRGQDVLKSSDTVFVMAETEKMVEIEKLLGKTRTEISSVTILGGGRTGLHLAQLLEFKNLKVKIIERDLERCHIISNKLKKCTVINGDGTDLNLLVDEEIGKCDLFVAVSGDDKANVLVSLLAKDLGSKKTIAEIRRSDYIPLVEKIGIDSVVSPRLVTAGSILKFIRKGHVVSVTLLEGAKAEMIEMIVPPNAKNIGKPLSTVKFPRGAIVGGLVRDNQVMIPTGNDCILAGDRVLIFAAPHIVQRVEKFFA